MVSYLFRIIVFWCLTSTTGIGATTQMRTIEATRRVTPTELDGDRDERDTRILALTGMSSLDDKRRAFEAGVDG